MIKLFFLFIKMKNLSQSDSTYLPFREPIPIGSVDTFCTAYSIPENKKDEFKKKHKNTLFYFNNDEKVMFGGELNAFQASEVLYRNMLRQRIDEIMGFTKYIRDLEFLLENIYDSGDRENSFIGKKIRRYKVFQNNLTTFILSMVHDQIWFDFYELKYTGVTIIKALENVIPIANQIKNAYQDVLDNEYNTTQFEKLLKSNDVDILDKKAYSAVEEVKKKSKSKKVKEDK